MARSTGRWRLAFFTTGTLLAAATPPTGGSALAQPSDSEGTSRRMNAIEGQIRALQDELRAMRRDLATRDAQLRGARQEAAQAREEARRTRVAPASSAPSPPAADAARLAQGRPPSRSESAPGLSAGAAPGGRLDAGQQNASTTPGPTTPSGAPGPGLPAGAAPGGTLSAGQQNASTTPGRPFGTFRIGPATVTLGGFVQLTGIFRTRNEVADVGTNWNTGIPLPNSPLYHEREFRGSARQSRLSLLIQGDVDASQKLGAYFESDFLGAGSGSNSVESNSYTPRLIQAYGTYENDAWGLYVLGGQAWSLATPHRTGLAPRQELVPSTIDYQFTPGFTWVRQPQLRVAKSFADRKIWLGLSLESPQATFAVGPNGPGPFAGTPNYVNPGGNFLNPVANYSNDIAPDIVAKLAWDPGFGHYEAFGLLRFLHDRVSVPGGGRNNTVVAGGGGVSAVIPILGSKLEFHGNLLAGYGIGRYGTTQFPDATLSRSGAPAPLPQIQALAGLVAHPVPAVDLYAYVGTEQVGRRSFSVGDRGYGYGSPLYINTGCFVELSTRPCQANTSGVVQGTLGGWWRFLHGDYGTMQAGAQYSYTRRSTFSGVGGSPGTDNNVVMVSLRYLPFQ